MSRNSSGTYTLPQSPFQANTTILSSAVNSNFSDIATALTQSLATTGVSTMTGQLFAANGSALAPSVSFGTSPSTGIYSAGANQFSFAANGLQLVTVTSSGFQLNTGTFLDTLGNKSTVVPVGTIIDYAGATSPPLWLLCFGQAISRTTYASLFAAIGTNWGVGDGSTTFNVPDLRGRATFGKDNMGGSAANRITASTNYDGTVLGNSGGSQNHTMTTGDLVSHTHTLTDPQHSHTMNATTLTATAGPSSAYYNQAGVHGISTDATSTGITIANTGSGNPFTVLSPSVIVNKIIFAAA